MDLLISPKITFNFSVLFESLFVLSASKSKWAGLIAKVFGFLEWFFWIWGAKKKKKKKLQDSNQVQKREMGKFGFCCSFFYSSGERLVWSAALLRLTEQLRFTGHAEPGSSPGRVGFISAKSIVNRINYPEHQGCRRWKIGGSYTSSVEKCKPLRRWKKWKQSDQQVCSGGIVGKNYKP